MRCRDEAELRGPGRGLEMVWPPVMERLEVCSPELPRSAALTTPPPSPCQAPSEQSGPRSHPLVTAVQQTGQVAGGSESQEEHSAEVGPGP